ncbi:helix-turn-helix domain-containing protein [Marinimicrobium koreense]|uniref:helix-turn-helix domain-containing protein n=1 Tax=Marinimicrobium koreense TaxID=306545 RepID=UPI003F729612
MGEVITLKEVADLLKVHERTVYRLAAKGEIPAFKVASNWRFRLEDIDCWIEEQKSLKNR